MRYKWSENSVLGKDLPVHTQYGTIVDCNGIELYEQPADCKRGCGPIYVDEENGIIEWIQINDDGTANVTEMKADVFRIPIKFVPY
jgi:hypothetical protein